MKDLKRWYASDQARKRVDRRDMVLTMARPTRPPGKYAVVVTGKNVPAKYHLVNTSGLVVEFAAGANTRDFALQ